jgi:hypothetical protein
MPSVTRHQITARLARMAAARAVRRRQVTARLARMAAANAVRRRQVTARLARMAAANAVRRCLVAVPAFALAVVLAGCGVPVDAAPRPIGNPHLLHSEGPLAAGAGARETRIYLVDAGRLVRVRHRVAQQLTPDGQLRELLNGPTADDSALGYTSALTTMTVTRMTVLNRRATVVIGEPSVPGARSDEVLAYGQIVCTLTSQGPEVGTVSFVSGGEPLAVPRADGSLSAGDLTIADYASLIDR